MEDGSTERSAQCPMCAESIKVEAIICKHCGSDTHNIVTEEEGTFVRVRLKASDKVYNGDIYVPPNVRRVSDMLNDRRSFVLMANTTEEALNRELSIGFVAINKTAIEWVRDKSVVESECCELKSESIFQSESNNKQ